MPKGFSRVAVTGITLIIGVLIGFGCSESARQAYHQAGADEPDAARPEIAETVAKPATKVQRFGAVIGLRPEKRDYYNRLHADPWPEINATLSACNIRNYSIYEGEIDGKLYLFAYFEYTGDDFKGDMAKMEAEPKFQQWWAETDPCQIRLPGTPEGEQWLKIPEVYHLD